VCFSLRVSVSIRWATAGSFVGRNAHAELALVLRDHRPLAVDPDRTRRRLVVVRHLESAHPVSRDQHLRVRIVL
jgi:hypothetical protein